MIKLNDSYLGFTNNFNPMQKAKIEKSLDQLIRYDVQVMKEKEYVIKRIQENFLPAYEENYSYYSPRTEAMTKPKTLYKLANDPENLYCEINKTLYNFAVYVIENNFNNDEIAQSYILQEQQQKEEMERITAQKEAEEREQRRIQAEQEKQQREAERLEKVKKWEEIGNTLMTDNIMQIITDTIESHWNDIIKAYPATNKEQLTNKAITGFPQLLGNYEYIKSQVHYLLFDSLNYNNINNTLYRSIYKVIFNVNETEPKLTITAKIKAFYSNKEYKGNVQKPIIPEEFYILNSQTKQFELREGEKKTISGVTCFIYKNEKDYYRVTEARTGLGLGSGSTNKREAIQKAKDGIEKAGERLESIIQSNINRFGLSPLYKEVEVATV